MHKIFLLTLLTLSFNTFAFEWHGIKSGMSKEEVDAITGGKSGWQDVGEGEIFNTTMGINPPNLFTVDFSYTSDDKLWRISLNFEKQSGARSIAQTRALNELYGSYIERSVNYYSSYSMPCLVVMFIDDELFEQDAEKFYKEQIDLY